MIDAILARLARRPTLRIVCVAPLPRAPLTRLRLAFSPSEAACPSLRVPRFSFDLAHPVTRSATPKHAQAESSGYFKNVDLIGNAPQRALLPSGGDAV